MLTGPKARGLWFMFGCLCVLAGFITAGRAATKPPAAAYQPNRTSDLHVIIAELDIDAVSVGGVEGQAGSPLVVQDGG